MFEWKLLFQLPTSLIFLNCQKYIFFRIQILILWASNASNLILYIFLMYFLSLYNRNLSNSILISSLYDYTTFSTLNYYFLISHFILFYTVIWKGRMRLLSQISVCVSIKAILILFKPLQSFEDENHNAHSIPCKSYLQKRKSEDHWIIQNN